MALIVTLLIFGRCVSDAPPPEYVTSMAHTVTGNLDAGSELSIIIEQALR